MDSHFFRSWANGLFAWKAYAAYKGPVNPQLGRSVRAFCGPNDLWNAFGIPQTSAKSWK